MSRPNVTAAQALMFALSMAGLARVQRSGARVTVAAVAAEMRKMAHVEPAELIEEAADAAIYAAACGAAKAAGKSDEEIRAAGDAACIAAGGKPGPAAPVKLGASAAQDAAEAAEIERRLDAAGVQDAADAIAAAIARGQAPKGGAQ